MAIRSTPWWRSSSWRLAFHHLQQGIQVVIEDYVHDKPLRVVLLLANTLLTLAFAMTGIFAVAKIAFEA